MPLPSSEMRRQKGLYFSYTSKELESECRLPRRDRRPRRLY